MAYLAEQIGEAYKQWSPSDIVLLTAPTGGGKTTFILKKLLPWAYDQKKRILYLVNRRILLEQLMVEVEQTEFFYVDSISITTYHQLEESLKTNNGYYDIMGYDYIICDEAHYFLSDSLFNTNTELSFEWIFKNSLNKVLVFMSATLEGMNTRINNYYKERRNHKTPLYNIAFPFPDYFPNREPLGNIYEYGSDADYSHLSCHILNGLDEVVSHICAGSEKWLIFVDSITVGKDLARKIKEDMSIISDTDKDAAIFLSAGYRNDDNAYEEVQNITKEKRQHAKVLICTSVMDNGITLKDIRLRNIVLSVDVKDEMLQMLGRKRLIDDMTPINVFLVNKSSREVFGRLSMYREMRRTVAVATRKIHRFKHDNSQEEYAIYKAKVDAEEEALVNEINRLMLEKIIYENNPYVRRMFYIKKDRLQLNTLSLLRVNNLWEFYTDLYEKIQDDEYALTKMQLEWLGFTEDDAIELVNREKETEYDRAWNRVNRYFSEWAGKAYEEKEWIQMRKLVNEDMITLAKVVIEDAEDQKSGKAIINAKGKNERGISQENVEWLNVYCGLKYKLIVHKYRRNKAEMAGDAVKVPPKYELLIDEE